MHNYTRQQIQNTIDKWNNVLAILDRIDENTAAANEFEDQLISESENEKTDYYLYITELNPGLKPPARKIGYSCLKDFNVKAQKLNTCMTKEFVLKGKIVFSPPLDKTQILEQERNLIDNITTYAQNSYVGSEIFDINDKDLLCAVKDFKDDLKCSEGKDITCKFVDCHGKTII